MPIKLLASSKEILKQKYQGWVRWHAMRWYDRNWNMGASLEPPIPMTKSPKLRNFRGGHMIIPSNIHVHFFSLSLFCPSPIINNFNEEWDVTTEKYVLKIYIRPKKKGIRFSGHFLQKQMRKAVFFFLKNFFPPKQMRQLFFFYPVKFGLKFKCKQKWKVRVMCILPGLRLLEHAAGTSLGFMFRVGTGFMQQTFNTQMLRHSSDTDEVCCQNNQS